MSTETKKVIDEARRAPQSTCEFKGSKENATHANDALYLNLCAVHYSSVFLSRHIG